MLDKRLKHQYFWLNVQFLISSTNQLHLMQFYIAKMHIRNSAVPWFQLQLIPVHILFLTIFRTVIFITGSDLSYSVSLFETRLNVLWSSGNVSKYCQGFIYLFKWVMKGECEVIFPVDNMLAIKRYQCLKQTNKNPCDIKKYSSDLFYCHLQLVQAGGQVWERGQATWRGAARHPIYEKQHVS